MAGIFEVLYSDDFLLYDLGERHPLNQVRVRLAHELIRATGLFTLDQVVERRPARASLDEVRRFHTDAYVDFVSAACQRGLGWLDQGDTPAFPGGVEAALSVVGGSLEALDAVASGRAAHAFNLGGGLHHAHPDRASGFCIFNDVAVAIAHALAEGPFRRLMYLDIDAHHGDGVMYGFYGDGRLLDIDFHEDGRYLFPGTGSSSEMGRGDGYGVKLNVPLPPATGDMSFMHAFQSIVPPAVRAFRPELIFMQCGADAHGGDPLTDLNLSLHSYSLAARQVHDLAHEVCEGRLVLFGGGGYSLASVALCWTRIARVIAGQDATIAVPRAWREVFEAEARVPAPLLLEEELTSDRNWDQVDAEVGFLGHAATVLGGRKQ